MKKYIHPDNKKESYRDWTRFLDESDKWNLDEIHIYELERLKKVISHAYENSIAYRRFFDNHNIHPRDLKTINDIRKFPMVTKEMMRDNVQEFCTVPVNSVEYITTGGSTGIPFGFYRDHASFAKELASKAHQYYRVGWKEGMKQMIFRGLPINNPKHMKYKADFRELLCSTYYLNHETMENYRKKAFQYKPDFIKCYPSSGYIFAKYLKESGKKFPPIKGILCASENLYDFQKELLSDVFKCRIFNHYGHYETAVLAGYCEYSDKLHVLPQYGYVELLDKNGKQITKAGEIGEIVATSFINTATPFIRYRTRDMAVFSGWTCQHCKRPYQIWERVEGRLQEFIVTKDDRLISMTAMNMHTDIFDSIKQFQFYQEEKGKVAFNYIPKSMSLNRKESEKIKLILLEKLGKNIDLILKRVESIPPTNRGKHRFLIQKLIIPYGDL